MGTTTKKFWEIVAVHWGNVPTKFGCSSYHRKNFQVVGVSKVPMSFFQNFDINFYPEVRQKLRGCPVYTPMKYLQILIGQKVSVWQKRVDFEGVPFLPYGEHDWNLPSPRRECRVLQAREVSCSYPQRFSRKSGSKFDLWPWISRDLWQGQGQGHARSIGNVYYYKAAKRQRPGTNGSRDMALQKKTSKPVGKRVFGIRVRIYSFKTGQKVESGVEC